MTIDEFVCCGPFCGSRCGSVDGSDLSAFGDNNGEPAGSAMAEALACLSRPGALVSSRGLESLLPLGAFDVGSTSLGERWRHFGETYLGRRVYCVWNRDAHVLLTAGRRGIYVDGAQLSGLCSRRGGYTRSRLRRRIPQFLRAVRAMDQLADERLGDSSRQDCWLISVVRRCEAELTRANAAADELQDFPAFDFCEVEYKRSLDVALLQRDGERETSHSAKEAERELRNKGDRFFSRGFQGSEVNRSHPDDLGDFSIRRWTAEFI